MSSQPRLRLAGGRRRGLRLLAPASIRPTSGRLREALFSIWGGRVEGCSFLDLFAGSGAVGLEAASRGAERVLLVEGDRRVMSTLERNLRAAALPGVSALLARLPDDLERRLPAGELFDLVFADPPYGFENYEELLAEILPRLAAGGAIALEHSAERAVPCAPTDLRADPPRRYGDSVLSVYRTQA